MASGAQPHTAEEEELQLALAISRSEAESKERERERLQKLYGVHGSGNTGQSSSRSDSVQQPMVLSGMDSSDMDPELARYLNRNYWQKKSETVALAPSAPQVTGISQSTVKSGEHGGAGHSEQLAHNGEQAQADKAQFLDALQSSLEIFVNRMRSNSQRGRPIANDSSVQSLFNVISSMHPQLLTYQQEIEDKRAYFEGLQDKLAQLRDAREALDSLRDEHREKHRQEMEELQRQRHIQMMQKLEIMRQKKHEYLEMQRQQALQRLQEQEREMAMRFEQQKQLTQMRQMQAYGYPQMYGQHQMNNPAGMMGAPGMMPPQTLPASVGPQGPLGPQNMMPGYVPGPQLTNGSSTPQLSGYGGQPMTQQGQPSGIEVPSGSGVPPGPLQGPQNPAMFMQPGVSQGPYPQGPALSGSNSSSSINPPMGSVPASYQPPNQIPAQAQLHLDGGQPPVVCGPGSSYSVPPPSMGYTSMPPTMDYSSFNMQSLASSLPQQQQPSQPGGMHPPLPQTPQQPPQQQGPGQQFIGGAPAPPNQFPPVTNRSNNQMPVSQHMHPQLPHALPPPQYQHTSQAPQQPVQDSLLDAQLISFD